MFRERTCSFFGSFIRNVYSWLAIYIRYYSGAYARFSFRGPFFLLSLVQDDTRRDLCRLQTGSQFHPQTPLNFFNGEPEKNNSNNNNKKQFVQTHPQQLLFMKIANICTEFVFRHFLLHITRMIQTYVGTFLRALIEQRAMFSTVFP